MREKRKKHGLSYLKEYSLLMTIKAKCYSPSDHNYKYYGARGITVYLEWLQNPKLFIEYIRSLPNYGTNTYSLDRIDNNQNYVPGNLQWSSKSNQVANRNIQSNNKSGYTGINWSMEKGKWRSRIKIDGECVQLGYFYDLNDAVIDRNEYIIQNGLVQYPIQAIK
jgi:hypothetical protein